ncbi:MAG TPA: 30S ribosomal protein S1 [Vicinamibacteria bacterium]|nr:30S ribosomal protein S1 [Vicinamibacteria bacterium]
MAEIEKTERTIAPIGGKGVAEEVREAEPEAEAAAEAGTDAGDGAAMDAEQYERLLDMYDVSFKNFAEGEVVKGVVLQVSESEVIVDVGYKSEGIIPIDEFRDETGKLSIKVGDTVDVLLEKTEDKEGYVVLSKEKAEKMKVWDDVERAYQERRVVTGRVIERVKGGLAVDIGVRAFLPGSQVDLRPVRNLDSLKGQELRMRVIKVNKKRGNIVLSRKAVLEEENAEKKHHTLATLEEGKVLVGAVKNITEYGAFVDLGGIDGLLHITDMSWGRINHPSEVVNVGDEIRVVVLKFDRESERVSLGLKQLKADPWSTATIRYPAGARVKGKVVSLTDYGAFVELEQGVEGLIHVSEMSWSKKVKHPSKVLTVGQEVECAVLGIDQEAHRISLGLKQVESNPWQELADKYPVGARLKGKVRNLTEFGAFVEVEEGIDGLVHISDLSWTKRVKHPSEVLKKGDTVEAIVLNIDAENQRLSLGLKQLATDMWDEFFAHHKVGDVVEGKMVRLTNFGAFVELAEGIEGLVHVSELDEKRIDKPEETFKPGEVFAMKILKINEGEKKIGLSIKAVKQEEYQKDIESYRETAASDRSTTLSEAFRAAEAARKQE